jgi:hypothetical protein
LARCRERAGKIRRFGSAGLLIDVPRWHTCDTVQILHSEPLVFLPKHSPEIQPAERRVCFTQGALANRSFESFAHLARVLAGRIQALDRYPLFVEELTRCHGRPQDAVPGATGNVSGSSGIRTS